MRALDESRQLSQPWTRREKARAYTGETRDSDEAFEMNEKSADCSEAMNGILHNLQIVVYGGREPLSRVDENNTRVYGIFLHTAVRINQTTHIAR